MTSQLSIHHLDGCLLDYFTGLALGYDMLLSNGGAGPAYRASVTDMPFAPQQDINLLQPVLPRMATMLQSKGDDGAQMWQARAVGSSVFTCAPDFATAVCRALVYLKYGPDVIPPPDWCNRCDDLFS